VLVDSVELGPTKAYEDAEQEVLLCELKADLNSYLQGRGGAVRELGALIAWNEAHHDQEMPYFGQELFLQAQAKGPLTEKYYCDALDRCGRLSRQEGIDGAMDRHHLDALIAPSGGPAGKTDLLYGDRDVGGSSSPAAVAGYPSITVPAGYVSGLPVGLSFFGKAYSEPTLLKLAYAFEQAAPIRRAPAFVVALE
jgi:amidase